MDNLSKQERSERMSRVRNGDTKPEMQVGRLVHGMGYRYRLHAKHLPGRPDMVFSKNRRIYSCYLAES
jgi:DNA mismatch endonuclease (patch repair protein)